MERRYKILNVEKQQEVVRGILRVTNIIDKHSIHDEIYKMNPIIVYSLDVYEYAYIKNIDTLLDIIDTLKELPQNECYLAKNTYK